MPEQISASTPALTTGAVLMISIMRSETAGHIPAGSLDVIVKATNPVVISATDGV